ncbi:MAG: histidine--tRNA ligase [Puniceicoccales bacterium]|jgi:histidyl-tRNA synthetase|nr:histidine--tRNA ligase [Puniceicoccales bacterium]
MRQILPGFRDFYPTSCAVRNYLLQNFRQVTRTYGFEEIDGPILEPLDLFVEKSGEEIVSQLFSFSDRGGREVALRPEFTPTLARMVAAQAATLKRPIRWCNVGEHFRYERPQRGRLRSFWQMNADLLGEGNVSADVEMIALLVAVFRGVKLGADDFVVRISDRRLWWDFLAELGLSSGQIPSILGIIDRFEREGPRELKKKLAELCPIVGSELFAAISDLRQCRTLENIKSVMGEKNLPRMDDWEKLLQLLDDLQLMPFIQIDLGIVRGLAYYTGFVFEAFERSEQGRALAGGGRYDDLLKKLHKTPLPACGFAIGDVTLGLLLQEKQLIPAYNAAPRVFVIFSNKTRKMALSICQDLRRSGISLCYDLHGESSFAKQLKEASKSGANFALFIGTDEVASGNFTLKNLSSGSVQTFTANELLSVLD